MPVWLPLEASQAYLSCRQESNETVSGNEAKHPPSLKFRPRRTSLGERRIHGANTTMCPCGLPEVVSK
jgi:hypothetical protein